MTYLLVAEVDKIQTFIMQSAKLRQVVGASSMLETFGENVQKYPQKFLGIHVKPGDFIASAGGAFRIRFATEQDARLAGQRLRQSFEKEVGGSITIAPPVEVIDERTVVESGNDMLRAAKTAGRYPTAVWHVPFQAICQSSGVELAAAYGPETNHPDDTSHKYLGHITQQKGQFRQENRVFNQWLNELNKLYPELRVRPPDQKATDADTYAWDSRQYVAYIVADGNHMGKVFNACDLRTAQKLSRELTSTTRRALAAAAAPLMFVRDPFVTTCESPLLPLIIGGDDVFALLPANWALDVARHYLTEYEAQMTALWQETGVGDILRNAYPDEYATEESVRATLGAAVVICKASYPYKSAHAYGEALLKKAKNAGKQNEPVQSMLTIGWIAGSTVPQDAHDDVHAYTPDLAGKLIDFRYWLKDMAAATQERLRLALERQDNRAVLAILERYGELSQPQDAHILFEAVDSLRGDGLYDLLNLWDFLLDSHKPEADYAEGVIYGD